MADSFNSLPLELNMIIAASIEGDKDFCNYRLICHATNDAVEGNGQSAWRHRFLNHFDPPRFKHKSGRPNTQLKALYQQRRKWLRRGTRFRMGLSRAEGECLKVLRDLIAECFSKDLNTRQEGAKSTSRNLECINEFVHTHDLLHKVLCPLGQYGEKKPDSLLTTIQLLLTPWSLDLDLDVPTFSFECSQKAVYETTTRMPIFEGLNRMDVNMDFALHIANFFKYHLTRYDEHTLFEYFKDLAECENPKAWKGKLEDGAQKLGKYWKGSYVCGPAYLPREEIPDIRRLPTGDRIFMDHLNAEDNDCGFQVDRPARITLVLILNYPPNNPNTADARFKAKTRAQHRSGQTPEGEPISFRFDADGRDNTEKFSASGWLNPLPPQHGIPGWQRLTMMKFYEDDGGSGSYDPDGLWAYEGVVLPGGQIVLGRWWAVDHGIGDGDMYSGPFILWNVDGSAAGDDGEPDLEDADEEADRIHIPH
ncbi:hypothetical protein B0A49_04540 [Cryomyces minteri]|uniref:Uncharacterized protein n=1 Tax=Cryomyces minteri TaxID=331657 RepID=A0A4U0X8J5_9PEZI|nr:hypothetical protein B0A49_04540 [Cryomyces minteri]